jgi:hypothetical protein
VAHAAEEGDLMTYVNFQRLYVLVVVGMMLFGIAQGRGKMAPYSSNGCGMQHLTQSILP